MVFKSKVGHASGSITVEGTASVFNEKTFRNVNFHEPLDFLSIKNAVVCVEGNSSIEGEFSLAQ